MQGNINTFHDARRVFHWPNLRVALVCASLLLASCSSAAHPTPPIPPSQPSTRTTPPVTAERAATPLTTRPPLSPVVVSNATASSATATAEVSTPTPEPSPTPTPEATPTPIPDKVEVSQITDRLPYKLAGPPTVYEGDLTVALGVQKELTDPNRTCIRPINGTCPTVQSFVFNNKEIPDAQQKFVKAVLTELVNAYQQYDPAEYGDMTVASFKEMLSKKEAPILAIPAGYIGKNIATVSSTTPEEGLYFDPNRFPIYFVGVNSARNLKSCRRPFIRLSGSYGQWREA